jgi:hypothetical protein
MPIPADIYKKIVDAKVFIDEHFDSPIGLDAIAGEACLSRFHFHRSDGVGNWYSVTQQKAH